MKEKTPEPYKPKAIQNEAVKEIIKRRNSVFARFPLLFTLLGAFGLVATNYGFTRIIDKMPLLANNPFITLAVGLMTLILIGALYKKLD
jgi:hypothetical protein